MNLEFDLSSRGEAGKLPLANDRKWPGGAR